MKKILLATGNVKKGVELAEMLGAGWSVQTLKDLPVVPEIVEDGLTFEANAVKKAMTLASVTDGLVLADDSGLEVDFLQGAPGVYSARFAGEPSNDDRNNALLLEKLKNVPDAQRTARFRCVIAMVRAGQLLGTFEGICHGRILQKYRGSGGFGYDPLFVPDGQAETFAELPAGIKNTISHRGKAMRSLQLFLEQA